MSQGRGRRLSWLVVLLGLTLSAAWWSQSGGADAQAEIPSVSVAAAAADEGQPLRFRVSLSAPAADDIVVKWRTEDDPSSGAVQAEAGVDYTAFGADQALTMHAGSTSAWIVVPTAQDAVYEGDETFRVRLRDLEGVAIVSNADRALGTIREDDAQPTVSLRKAGAGSLLGTTDTNDAEVTLEGGSADEPAEMRFEVRLSGLSALPVTAPYTLGGTATAGVDYIDPPSKQVVIGAGELSAVIEITTTPDAVAEDHESVIVTLGQPTNGVLTTEEVKRSAQGWIYDDDKREHVVVTVSPREAYEHVLGPQIYTVTATLGGGATAEAETTTVVGVGGVVIGGRAYTAGVDDVTFSELTQEGSKWSFQITIAAGQRSGQRSFKAEVVADQLDEIDEAFGFDHGTNQSVAETGRYHGYHSDGYSFFYPRVTVRDDDGANRPTVSVADAAAVSEGDDPAVTTNMSFDVNLSAASGKPITVHYALGGTATAGLDYEPPPFSLTIAAGQTRGRIVVPVRGDALDEGAGETITVILLRSFNAPLSAAAGARTAAGLINDDDAPPSLSVTDAAAVDEGDAASFTVSLDAASGQDVTFQWRTAEHAGATHPAAAGEDYEAVGGRTVTIPAGSLSLQLSVATLDDATDEYAETFLVQLSNPSGATLSASAAEATGTINADPSDPQPSLTIADAADVTEGDDPNATTPMTFTVRISAVSGKQVSVEYAVSSETASAGVDYTAPSSSTLTIAAGQQTGAITIPIKGDTEEELHEILTVTLSNPVHAALGQPSSAQGKILDDERDRGKPWIGIRIKEASIVEGEDATVEVTASWASKEDIDVNFYVSSKHYTASWQGERYNGQPERGAWFEDERGVGLQIATLPAGQREVEFTIGTRSDSADLDGEIWAAMLTPGLIRTEGIRNIGNRDGSLDPYDPDWDSLPYLTGTPDFDRVKVLDGNDAVSPNFTLHHLGRTTITAGEPAMFRLTADRRTPAPVTVSYAVAASGEADVLTAGATSEKTITVPAGTRAEYIIIPTVNRGSGDSATLTVNLTRGAYTRALTVGREQALDAVHVKSVTVRDVAPSSSTPVATISSTGDISEGGAVTFTVTVDHAQSEEIIIATSLRSSGDFGFSLGGSSGPLHLIRLPANRTSVSFTVTTVDDNVDEPDGSITLILRTDDDYRVGGTYRLDATITDDDAPGSTPEVSVAAGADVSEGEHASFTITADPLPTVAFDVKLSLTASGDFGVDTHDRTVTIPTSGSASVNLATTDDQIDESDGSVTASLQAGSGYTVSAASSSATVAVADNDVGPIVSVSAGPDVTEGGKASFTLSADPPPDSPLAVSVKVSASGNYGVTTGTGSFTIPTSGSVTLTVGTSDDNLDEADGSVTATLEAGSDYTVSSSQGSATVSVSDDDVPELGITGGSGITEGGTASFTITASPVPASPLTVNMGVSESGDFGATGAATVSVSGATTTYTISTADDSIDEADGSVTATLQSGSDYTVSSSNGAATVSVSDNDVAANIPAHILLNGSFEAPAVTAHGGTWQQFAAGTAGLGWTVTGGPLELMRGILGGGSEGSQHAELDGTGPVTISQVLTTEAGRSYTVSFDYKARPGTGGATNGLSATWNGVDIASGLTFTGAWRNHTAQVTGTGSDALAISDTGTADGVGTFLDNVSVTPVDSPPQIATTPVVSILAGGNVHEGDSASFTITATPAPSAPLPVTVKLSGASYYGVTDGDRTVTIPTSGSAKLEVQTKPGASFQHRRFLTAALQAGTGYIVTQPQVSQLKRTVTVTVFGRSLPTVRVVAVRSGSGFEGDYAYFNVYSSLLDSTPTINLKVDQSGGYVTSPPTTLRLEGSSVRSRLWIPTNGDDVHKPNGSVTVTLLSGLDYRLHKNVSELSATYRIKDDDPAPRCIVELQGNGSAQHSWDHTCRTFWDWNVTKFFRFYVSQSSSVTLKTHTWEAGVAHIRLRDGKSKTRGAGTLGHATVGSGGYHSTLTRTLQPGWYLVDVHFGSTGKTPRNNAIFKLTVSGLPAQPNLPVLSITGGSAITEGGTASFTITASPAPTSPLTVNIGVSESGSFGASGASSVTVSGATTTYTITTADDTLDEPDGSVTATLQVGSGYRVSSTAAAATVTVADDDLPVIPELSISGGKGVIEGTAASFTITASPAPTSPITVKLSVAQSGDYGASGASTVTISGVTTTYTISTADDQVNEPHGSVTATLQSGSEYTVSSTNGDATVTVYDNEPDKVIPDMTITGPQSTQITEGETLVITVSATLGEHERFTPKTFLAGPGNFGIHVEKVGQFMRQGHSISYKIHSIDDAVDEPDGQFTFKIEGGTFPSTGTDTITVTVRDNDEPPPPVVTQPEDACRGLPTVSIDDVTAKRTDATVTFTVSIDCKPGGTVTAYVSEAVDGTLVTGVTTIILSAEQQSQTYTMNVRPAGKQTLVMSYALGAANRHATGTVVFE